MNIKYQGRAPTRATGHSAGLDLYADEDAYIGPGQLTKVRTGTFMEIPIGCVGLLFLRSGFSTRNSATLQNAVGVIDADYRGELAVFVRNEGLDPIQVMEGDRIAQLVIVPCMVRGVECAPLSDTSRGEGGFGSTGR